MLEHQPTAPPPAPTQAVTPRSVVAAVVFTAIVSVVLSTLVMTALLGEGPPGPRGEPGPAGPAAPRSAAGNASTSADAVLQAIRDNATEVALTLSTGFNPPFSQVSDEASRARASARSLREDFTTLCLELQSSPALGDAALTC